MRNKVVVLDVWVEQKNKKIEEDKAALVQAELDGVRAKMDAARKSSKLRRSLPQRGPYVIVDYIAVDGKPNKSLVFGTSTFKSVSWVLARLDQLAKEYPNSGSRFGYRPAREFFDVDNIK